MSWERFTGVFVRGEYTEATGFGYLIPGDWMGLDYESARDATPVWYGVSSGNGNNGVSHLYPDYYVRTADPFRLAELASLQPRSAEPISVRPRVSVYQVGGCIP